MLCKSIKKLTSFMNSPLEGGMGARERPRPSGGGRMEGGWSRLELARTSSRHHIASSQIELAVKL